MTILPIHAASTDPDFQPIRRAPTPAYWDQVPPHPFLGDRVRTANVVRPIVPGAGLSAPDLGETEMRWIIAVGGAILSAILGALCGAALSL